MRRIALAIASLLVAAPLTAQDAARDGEVAPEGPVLLRLSADGDYLGAVRGEGAGAEILVAPLQPALRAAGAGPLTIGGLFSMPAGDGPRVVASAARRQAMLMAVPALPPAWCQGMVGLVAHAAECALQASSAPAPLPALAQRSVALGWGSNRFELALAAGTTSGWSAGPVAPWAAPGPATWEGPALLAPMGMVDTRDASLTGLWRLAPWGGLTFSATLGETRWQVLPGTAPLDLDQAAVQLGLAYGAFSGGITGRAVRAPGAAEPLWSGLDIGFAWRTPWRGELSFGAQNVTGRSSPLQGPVAPVLDGTTARTPYVRYTQDL